MTEDYQEDKPLTLTEEHDSHRDIAIEHSLAACAIWYENQKNLEAIEQTVFDAVKKILENAPKADHDERRFLAWWAMGDLFEEFYTLAHELQLVAAELASHDFDDVRREALLRYVEMKRKCFDVEGSRGIFKHKSLSGAVFPRLAETRFEENRVTYEVVQEKDWLWDMLPSK